MLAAIFIAVLGVAVFLAWRAAHATTTAATASALGGISGADGTPLTAALLVFAHPDDEAMFFTPLLLHLARSGAAIHMLCLSSGDYRGLGRQRTAELRASAAYYQPAARVTVVEDGRTRDGPGAWPADAVAAHVAKYLRQHDEVRAVFTFDAGGVSGHRNHIDTYHGVRRLVAADPAGGAAVMAGRAVYALTTRQLALKYTGCLGVLPIAAGRGGAARAGGFTLVAAPGDAAVAMRGLSRHASQLVWFRYLFVVFSRYSFINDFERL
jgi:N-acetylglucosaminylphosphatidylinositol deacetylase